MEIQDDRTEEEKAATIGFWVANDKAMSGWGRAQGRSIVACPVVSSPDCDIVRKRFQYRDEFRYVRFVDKSWRPKLRQGDHLHIYDTKTSFRYSL